MRPPPMHTVVVDTYYPAFLHGFYRGRPGLAHQPYAEQQAALMAAHFGTADYYSRNLAALGLPATEIVANCEPLQRAWAKENGLSLPPGPWAVGRAGDQWTLGRRWGFVPWPRRPAMDSWFLPVLEAQIRALRPKVLFFQDMNSFPPDFLRGLRPHVGRIVGQIAYSLTPGADFSAFDLILSSLPHYVERFRAEGIASELFRLGFEATLLGELTPEARKHEVVHVGGYSPIHTERNEVLEYLVEAGVPLACWGYGLRHLDRKSPIRRCYRGELWGLEMHNLRYNSRIVVSKHIRSVAGPHANIMTMYEATGVGSLLVIDERSDLDLLFQPGQEVATYRTPAECAEVIFHFLGNEAERQRVAAAGQARTLAQHTYARRMQEYLDILADYL